MRSITLSESGLVLLVDAAEGRELTVPASQVNAPSPREELYAAHEALCQKALDLMKRKNADYASADDPFRNFRMYGRQGIEVRMSDKLARLRSLRENGKVACEDETMLDTITDIINYCVLYAEYPDEL